MIGAQEIAPLSAPDSLVRGLPEPGVDDDADMYVLKVPGLRNVAMTPPYFHDGAINALEEAVGIMAKVQLGKDLAQQDVAETVSAEPQEGSATSAKSPHARVNHDANHFVHADFDQLRRERSLSRSAQQRGERRSSRRGSGSERL